MFPGRNISCFGNIKCPTHWPDHGVPDYFLWGYVKSKVYETHRANIAGLKQQILECIQGIPKECYNVVTAGVYRTTWWSHTSCHFKTVMTEMNSWTWNALSSVNNIFPLCLKKLFHFKKNCQVFLTHPVHTSTHWINFALFVGESTSCVIVSMHILCDVEYSCQRTCYVILENGLQISEMLQCSWFYSRRCNSTQKTCAVSTYNCGLQTLGHRS